MCLNSFIRAIRCTSIRAIRCTIYRAFKKIRQHGPQKPPEVGHTYSSAVISPPKRWWATTLGGTRF
ncbi:MAG TPA: hypothetical protein ENI48_07495 [Thioploca sp.]|nr:hypothetical protein [Thioploca sp.]